VADGGVSEDSTTQLTRIIEAARAGDAVASERLWSEVASQHCLLAILAALPPRLRSRVDVEDALQLTLTRAWRDLDRLRDISTSGLRRWIARVARNVVVDMVRELEAAKRGGAGPRDVAGPNTPLPPPGGLSRLIARREACERVVQQLDALPVDQRDVVIWRILEGRSTLETARAMNLEPSHVRVLLYRGLIGLKQGLRAQGFRSTQLDP
jgi:RNA polymerase sigma-70 factor (ECF subfamily)